jgi:hypothetical protein
MDLQAVKQHEFESRGQLLTVEMQTAQLKPNEFGRLVRIEEVERCGSRCGARSLLGFSIVDLPGIARSLPLRYSFSEFANTNFYDMRVPRLAESPPGRSTFVNMTTATDSRIVDAFGGNVQGRTLLQKRAFFCHVAC